MCLHTCWGVYFDEIAAWLEGGEVNGRDVFVCPSLIIYLSVHIEQAALQIEYGKSCDLYGLAALVADIDTVGGRIGVQHEVNLVDIVMNQC